MPIANNRFGIIRKCPSTEQKFDIIDVVCNWDAAHINSPSLHFSPPLLTVASPYNYYNTHLADAEKPKQKRNGTQKCRSSFKSKKKKEKWRRANVE